MREAFWMGLQYWYLVIVAIGTDVHPARFSTANMV
jgi:hypothetical protein